MEEEKNFRPLALINPEIISQDGKYAMEEGCLSLPDVRSEVERTEHITVRYRNTKFDSIEMETGGLLARVILHEIDHLNGVLFTDYLSPDAKRPLRPKLDRLRRGEADIAYPIVTVNQVAVS